MSNAIDQVLDLIGNMTVLELSELKTKFEDKFGVTAAAPVMMAAGGGAGAGGAAAPLPLGPTHAPAPRCRPCNTAPRRAPTSCAPP